MKNQLIRILFVIGLLLPLSLNAGKETDDAYEGQLSTVTVKNSFVLSLEDTTTTVTFVHLAFDGADILLRGLLPQAVVKIIEVPRMVSLGLADFFNIRELLFRYDNSENRTQATVQLIRTGAIIVHTAADIMDLLTYLDLEPTSYWSTLSPYIAGASALVWSAATFWNWWSSPSLKEE